MKSLNFFAGVAAIAAGLLILGCGSDDVVGTEPATTQTSSSATSGPKPDGTPCETNIDCMGGNVCADETSACVAGLCASRAAGDALSHTGFSCSDGSMCTTGDTCSGGKCSGKVVDCDDKTTCTNDSCDPKLGCVHKTQVGVQCTDGNACTSNDACITGGKCAGEQVECDDKNPCTSDSCDPAKGCVNSFNANPCDDGNVCTEGDVCKDGACGAGKAKSCDDGNVCTDDSCDMTFGCKFSAKADAAKFICSDKDPTTADDVCVSGKCIGKAFWQCDVDEDCLETIKTKCGTPVCVPIDPAKPTEKTCKVIFTASVDDGNPCTADSCDILKGVLHETMVGAPCADGDACTVLDSCTAEKTCKGSTKQCEDGDACTFDSCDKNTGNCVHVVNPCNDGNAFSEDSCTLGSCKNVAGVITAKPQMPEGTSATDIVENKLSTKLNAWLENVLGEQSSAQPVKNVQVLDAKTTCTAMYSGPKLCFNAWLTIGITDENINIGGASILITDSSIKDGTFVKPTNAGIGFYELADACIGWEQIPICVLAKGK